MRYVLNSAVITTPGTYRYHLIVQDEVKFWLEKPGYVSRVGYPATVNHLESVAGVRISLSREETRMQVGDEALVIRLKYRMQDPTQKKVWQPGPDDWEYGILERLE